MRTRGRIVRAAGLAGLCAGVVATAVRGEEAKAPAAASVEEAAPKPADLGLVVYPAGEQNAEKQRTDESECYAWAREQTGIDPRASAAAATEPAPGPGATRTKGAGTMRRSHRTSHAWLAPAIVAAVGLLAGPVGAGEAEEHEGTVAAQDHEGTREEAHEAHGEAAEHGEEHGAHGGHPRNALALFLGGTVESAEDETFFTIGGEYERRFSDRWAGQLVVEHVNEYDAWVVLAPVGFRVVDKLWISAGPGLETEPRRAGGGGHDGGHETDSHGEEHTLEPHEEADGPFFVWRFGVNYGIHFNEKWGLMPSFNLDLVREHGEWVEAWVFGVSLAYHF